MSTTINILKLSKDICGIIDKYSDFSFDTMKSNIIKFDKLDSKFKNSDTTMTNILIKASLQGCSGFYLNKRTSLCRELINMINKENLINKVRIITEGTENCYIQLKGMETYKICHFESLDMLIYYNP